MEEGRLMPTKKEKPQITISSSMSEFVKSIDLGDKGEMNISGIVEAERKSEIDDKIYKSLKITKISPATRRLL